MLNKNIVVIIITAMITVITSDGVVNRSSTITTPSLICTERATGSLLIQKTKDTLSQHLSTISDSYD